MVFTLPVSQEATLVTLVFYITSMCGGEQYSFISFLPAYENGKKNFIKIWRNLSFVRNIYVYLMC